MAGRSTLEYWLMGVCLILVALIVVLLIALSRKSAPLEPAWGSWAEWAGVVVTSLGFVGAIITVYMQARSLRMQEQRHHEERQKEEHEAKKAAEELAREAKREREKWAHALDYRVFAKHRRPISSSYLRPSDGELTVLCKATVREGQYADVILTVPELPEGFTVQWDRQKESVLRPGATDSVAWKAVGREGFDGDDDKALEWLQDNTFVQFTDPAGIRWRKDATNQIEEIPSP